MLPGVTCSAAAAEFALVLSSGSLAFLWDHQVDVDNFRLKISPTEKILEFLHCHPATTEASEDKNNA